MLNLVIGVVMMMVSFIMSVLGSTSDVDSVLVFVCWLVVTAIEYMALAVYLDYRNTFPKVTKEVEDVDDRELEIDEDVKKEVKSRQLFHCQNKRYV
ncbi:hypothetical protein F442_00265 [Phytophthora nicotianae P10297]|uniref:Uncharacterized protein n=1 Tax=Phytophthora nicotianae P10297 TaxID=1317064 RepID=W3A6B0_PHYNI|nr:hypothetical protein F442_00265 [Phytophthora nicotianae P10297]